jgi:hypothetical protein
MVVTERELCGDEGKRVRAFDALKSWMDHRFSRGRGINLPNLWFISWQARRCSSRRAPCSQQGAAVPGPGRRAHHVPSHPSSQASDRAEGTARKPTPQFRLSDRFCENFGVRPAAPPLPAATVAVPEKGDELNFYQLSITHSEGLSKDECFVFVREILLGLAQAAGAGEQVIVNFGVGTLVCVDRVVSFEFGSSSSEEQLALRKGGGLTEAIDPMMGGRASAPTLMLVGAGWGGGSVLGVPRPRSELSVADTEIETQLLCEIDALDPETRAYGGTLSKLSLTDPTYSQIGRALHLDPSAVRGRALSEVNEALVGRAAALEAQLAEAQRATQELEARLRQREQRVRPLSSISQRHTLRTQHPSAAVAGAAPGGLRLGGSACGGGVGQPRQVPVRRAPAPSQRAGFMPHGGIGAGGAPILSVGFNTPPAAVRSPAKRVFGDGPVPVAPPLPPYHGPISHPAQDAAQRAWKAYGAPEARRSGGQPATVGRRSAGALPTGAVVSAASPASMRPHYRATLGGISSW